MCQSPFVVSCRARSQIPLERRKRACRRLVTGLFRTISTCRGGLKPRNFPVTSPFHGIWALLVVSELVAAAAAADVSQ